MSNPLPSPYQDSATGFSRVPSFGRSIMAARPPMVFSIFRRVAISTGLSTVVVPTGRHRSNGCLEYGARLGELAGARSIGQINRGAGVGVGIQPVAALYKPSAVFDAPATSVLIRSHNAASDSPWNGHSRRFRVHNRGCCLAFSGFPAIEIRRVRSRSRVDVSDRATLFERPQNRDHRFPAARDVESVESNSPTPRKPGTQRRASLSTTPLRITRFEAHPRLGRFNASERRRSNAFRRRPKVPAPGSSERCGTSFRRLQTRAEPDVRMRNGRVFSTGCSPHVGPHPPGGRRASHTARQHSKRTTS